jgi:hypothetical protein
VPRLPNETAEQHAGRRNQAASDRSTIWEYQRQEALVEKAMGAFLGEVLTSTVNNRRTVAMVKPLLAVKGTLPAQPLRLENYDLPGHCVPFPAIDGEGALGQKGDLVFVFTGLETHPVFRPRGIDSLKTSRTILNQTLVKALKRYGLKDTAE